MSENYKKIDEIPFDFNRRRLTTVVQNNAGTIKMVTKGAFEEMLSICSFAEYNGNVQPITNDFRQRILETADILNEKGFRVLAIARKDIKILSKKVLGKNKNVVKMLLEDTDGTVVEGIYFGDGEEFLEDIKERKEIDIIYYPDINEYNGRESLQIVISNYR